VHDHADALRRAVRFMREEIGRQSRAMAASPSLQAERVGREEECQERYPDSLSQCHRMTPKDTKAQTTSNSFASVSGAGEDQLSECRGISYACRKENTKS
jgi:hypothetical protein